MCVRRCVARRAASWQATKRKPATHHQLRAVADGRHVIGSALQRSRCAPERGARGATRRGAAPVGSQAVGCERECVRRAGSPASLAPGRWKADERALWALGVACGGLLLPCFRARAPTPGGREDGRRSPCSLLAACVLARAVAQVGMRVFSSFTGQMGRAASHGADGPTNRERASLSAPPHRVGWRAHTGLMLPAAAVTLLPTSKITFRKPPNRFPPPIRSRSSGP